MKGPAPAKAIDIKSLVQLRLEVYEGQHDALVTFYKTYPKVFVNKLLLRICEAFLPKYEPSLALYEPNHAPKLGESKKISVRLSKEKCPLLWDFYMNLDYGCRGHVMVNLMDRYVQILEADRSMLENFHWRGEVTSPESPALPEPVSGQASGSVQLGAPEPAAQHSDDGSALPVSPHVAGDQPTAQEVDDPLASYDTGL